MIYGMISIIDSLVWVISTDSCPILRDGTIIVFFILLRFFCNRKDDPLHESLSSFGIEDICMIPDMGYSIDCPIVWGIHRKID